MIRHMLSVQGLKGRAAYNANKKIRPYVRVTWQQAQLHFKRVTLPRWTKLTKDAFELDEAMSCTRIVTLPLFRSCLTVGTSMGSTNDPSAFDRRMEMRHIKYNISVKRYDRVPTNIRSMKRLWSYARLQVGCTFAEMQRRFCLRWGLG